MAVQDIWLFDGEATAEDVKLRPEGAEPGGYSISGTVYTNEGVTDIGENKTIAVSVNGAKQGTTDETNLSGEYTIPDITIALNDLITVFIDGETEKGCTVTRVTAANQVDIDIYVDHVIVRYETGSSINIANMDSAGDSGVDADIRFTVTTGALALTGSELYVWTGKTFQAEDNVTSDDIKVLGTFQAYANAGSVTISINTGGTFANNGTTEVTDSTNTVRFTATSGTFTYTGSDIVENDLSYTIGSCDYQQDFVVS